jgi:hypothetical protein
MTEGAKRLAFVDVNVKSSLCLTLMNEGVLISPLPDLLPDVIGRNLGRPPDFG